MIPFHPITERFNAEILADLLQDEVRDYLKALLPMQGQERAERCPLDVLFKVQEMTKLFEAMQYIPWTYVRLRKWLNSWAEGSAVISGWFIGLIDTDGPTKRIAALSANLRELADGKTEIVDYDCFPPPELKPCHFPGTKPKGENG